MPEERFSRTVIETLAKRAVNLCSNIDCGILTAGPAEDTTRAINVGEAAHIYGARAGAARYRPEMSDVERGEITNGIWLCCTCHKMVDDDPIQFPAELLFEWRRTHEAAVMENLGKKGALLREKIFKKRFPEFENSSYLAQQIVLDQPYAWEYKLTAELLRSMLEPIKARWEALEKGLYALPNQIIPQMDYFMWHQSQLNLVSQYVRALEQIFNGEIQKAWGEPGEPGSESQIYRTCALVAEACQGILRWEESIRFVSVSSEFEDVRELLEGVAGLQMKKILEVPAWFAKIFETENPTGAFQHEIVFELPAQWVEDCNQAMKRAEKKLLMNIA